jgi:hypothetical protein
MWSQLQQALLLAAVVGGGADAAASSEAHTFDAVWNCPYMGPELASTGSDYGISANPGGRCLIISPMRVWPDRANYRPSPRRLCPPVL